MKTTANYGLKKPEGTDVVNIDDFNYNADIIDTQIKSLNDKKIDYGTASGTNTYTVTIPGATLTEGRSYKIKFTNANTGAATLNINGLGAKEIRKSNGNALSSGNIKAGQILHLVYTGSVFQLLGEGGEYGTATADKVLTGYTIGTESGIVSGTMPNNSGKTQEAAATYSQEGLIRLRPPKGYYDGANGSCVDWADKNFKRENIKPGVTIFGQTGTFTSDATATASQILSGKTAYVKGDKITGTMPNNGAKIITPSTTNQAIPAGYHNGSGYVKGDANLKPENIRKDVSLFNIVGTLKTVGETLTPNSNNSTYLRFGAYVATNGTTSTDGELRTYSLVSLPANTVFFKWVDYKGYYSYKNETAFRPDQALSLFKQDSLGRIRIYFEDSNGKKLMLKESYVGNYSIRYTRVFEIVAFQFTNRAFGIINYCLSDNAYFNSEESISENGFDLRTATLKIQMRHETSREGYQSFVFEGNYITYQE